MKFFGDNGGIQVDGITSEPFNFTEPTEWFEPDLNIPPGHKELDDEGEPGFTATVTRTITYPDGTKESQTWTWRYHPHPMIFLVHPCMLPDDHPDYDPQYSDGCVLTLPGGLIGSTMSEAASRLRAAGFTVDQGNPCDPNDPSLEDLVAFVGVGNTAVGAGAKFDAPQTIRIRPGRAGGQPCP